MSTAADGPVGSPAYMSPEQIRADRTLDHRTDIWSLGVILFEMLTGVRPFKGTGQELLQNILTAEIPPVSKLVRFIDPASVALISRCLERDRDKRIASAADIAQSLHAHASPEPSGIDMSTPQCSPSASSPSFSGFAPPVPAQQPNTGYGRPSRDVAGRSGPRSQGVTSPLEGVGAAAEYTPSGTLKWSGPAAEAMGAALRARLSGSTTSTAALVQSSGTSAGTRQGLPSGASSGSTRRGRTAWVIAGISALIVLAGGLYVLLRLAAAPPAAEAAGKALQAAKAPAAQPGASPGAIAGGSHLAAPTAATSSDPAIPSAAPVNRSSSTGAPVDNRFYEEMDPAPGDGIYDGLDRKPPSRDGVYD